MRRWRELSREFDRLYARDGRPSIPPERLLRALLLQAFYTVRSERQLMEQLDYNLLFRWFVGLSVDDPVWDATVFCKNRDRLLDGDIAAKFMTRAEPAAGAQAAVERALLGRRHADRGLGQHEELRAEGRRRAAVVRNGTAEAGAMPSATSMARSARTTRMPRPPTPMHGCFAKARGKEAKLCHMGHLMTENRNGLIVDARLTEANGTAERETALDMIDDNAKPGSTVGGRQELRYRRLRRRLPRTRLHAACRSEQHQSPLGDRWTHDPPCRLCHQHEEAQAHRGALRLDEDHRRHAQDPSSRA